MGGSHPSQPKFINWLTHPYGTALYQGMSKYLTAQDTHVTSTLANHIRTLSRHTADLQNVWILGSRIPFFYTHLFRGIIVKLGRVSGGSLVSLHPGFTIQENRAFPVPSIS